MYPNRLALYMHQFDGAVMVSCRPEMCALADVRPCDSAEMGHLDRQFVLQFCELLSSDSRQEKAPPSSTTSVTPCSPLDKKKMRVFTSTVAKYFQTSDGQMERSKLETMLVESGVFSKDEVASGLSDLERSNKIMCS